MDSGASFHTTLICEVLKNYVAGRIALTGVGLGNVRIRVHNDSVRKLQKVKHVPALKKNLILVG
jgi:hypothetical protein